MATGQNIIDALPLPSGVLRPADQLTAVNDAILAAWPAVKVWKYSTDAGTFDDQTFEYSLSALTDLTEEGITSVWVNPATSTDEPNWQIDPDLYDARRADSTWTLIFSSRATTAYDTQTFDVEYVAKPSVLTALSDTLDEELDVQYLKYYVTWWAYERALGDQGVERSYERHAERYLELWQSRLSVTQTLAPSQSYSAGKARLG